MAFDRITDGDLLGKGNIGRPDTPGVDTAEMQRILDELPREVIVPAFNRLTEQLEDPGAAAGLGAAVPAGLPEGTPATVQGALEALNARAEEGFAGAGSALAAHTGRTDNPHAVTAAQTGAYTRAETDAAIGQRVVEIGAGDMAKSVYDPQDGRIDVTVQTYVHTKSGTVHNFAGSGANGRAKLTADVAAGDTFTVNGAPVTAYMGAESAADAMAGGSWSGRWVSFVFDGATLDFKGGGGRVTVSGLSAGAVKTGVTVAVKQGAKTVQTVTGTFTSDANAWAGAMLSGYTAYVNGTKIAGTIPSKADAIYTPSTVNQVIAAGQYLSGTQTIVGSPNLAAGNIRAGVNIFGVVGNVQALASNQFFAGYYGMWGVVDATNYSPAFCRTEYGYVSGSSIVVNFTGTIQFNSYFSCAAQGNSNSGVITVTRSGAAIYSYGTPPGGGITGSRTYFDNRNIRVSVSAGQQLVFSCSGQNNGTVWCYLTRVG